MVARLLIGCVVIAALTAVAGSTTVFEAVGIVADKLVNKPLVVPDLTPAQAGAPQTILILGSDRRWLSKDLTDRSDPPHSDTIMLVRLDPSSGVTTLMSVPRDLQVSFGSEYDVKINQAFSDGGPAQSVAVLEKLLNIKINDVVVLNFVTFASVVDDLGCVYIDVDHDFFIPPNTGVSAIDIHPGYQPLCYDTALSYVRFRHYDSTFARDAREQDFLRQAKQQLGVSGLLSNYQGLLNTIGKSVQTNIHGTNAVLRLLLIAQSSVSGPVRQVPFAAEPIIGPGGADNETATTQQIQQNVAAFLGATPKVVLPHSSGAGSSSSGGHASKGHHTHHAAFVPSAPGLIGISSYVKPLALEMQVHTSVPVLVPTLVDDIATQPDSSDFYGFTEHVGPHASHAGKIYSDYRVTWNLSAGAGEYYGFEGMDWTDPPLFAYADHATWDGRHYEYVLDGAKIRYLGWTEGKDLYWVSNTIFDNLSNEQMIALAESAQPIAGSHGLN
jgi:LCP family protein required for cell wall assembly